MQKETNHIARLLRVAALFSLVFASAPGHAGAAEPVGEVAELVGISSIQRGEPAELIPLRFGDEVFAGDLIRTQSGAKVKLLFNDDSVITVGPTTRLRIDSSVYSPGPSGVRNSVLTVLGGKVRSLVSSWFSSPLQDNRFEVRTPTAVAGVRGTEFITSVDNDGRSTVIVLDGIVEVYNRRDSKRRAVFLGKGMKSSVGARSVPSTPEKLQDSELEQAAEELDISAEETLTNSGELAGGPDAQAPVDLPPATGPDSGPDVDSDPFADMDNPLDQDGGLPGQPGLEGQDVDIDSAPASTRVRVEVDFQ